jgi:hypothetical protein
MYVHQGAACLCTAARTGCAWACLEGESACSCHARGALGRCCDGVPSTQPRPWSGILRPPSARRALTCRPAVAPPPSSSTIPRRPVSLAWPCTLRYSVDTPASSQSHRRGSSRGRCEHLARSLPAQPAQLPPRDRASLWLAPVAGAVMRAGVRATRVRGGGVAVAAWPEAPPPAPKHWCGQREKGAGGATGRDAPNSVRMDAHPVVCARARVGGTCAPAVCLYPRAWLPQPAQSQPAAVTECVPDRGAP